MEFLTLLLCVTVLAYDFFFWGGGGVFSTFSNGFETQHQILAMTILNFSQNIFCAYIGTFC